MIVANLDIMYINNVAGLGNCNVLLLNGGFDGVLGGEDLIKLLKLQQQSKACISKYDQREKGLGFVLKGDLPCDSWSLG